MTTSTSWTHRSKWISIWKCYAVATSPMKPLPIAATKGKSPVCTNCSIPLAPMETSALTTLKRPRPLIWEPPSIAIPTGLPSSSKQGWCRTMRWASPQEAIRRLTMPPSAYSPTQVGWSIATATAIQQISMPTTSSAKRWVSMWLSMVPTAKDVPLAVWILSLEKCLPNWGLTLIPMPWTPPVPLTLLWLTAIGMLLWTSLRSWKTTIPIAI